MKCETTYDKLGRTAEVRYATKFACWLVIQSSCLFFFLFLPFSFITPFITVNWLEEGDVGQVGFMHWNLVLLLKFCMWYKSSWSKFLLFQVNIICGNCPNGQCTGTWDSFKCLLFLSSERIFWNCSGFMFQLYGFIHSLRH